MERFNLSTLKKVYNYPAEMKRDDGSSRYAFVTFLMRNDNYLPGALLFGYCLREKRTQADLVCLVTRNISAAARYALGMIYDHIIEVDEIYIPSKRGHERQDIPYVFTRFNALRLGKDGDLNMNYDKIVVADADILPVRFYEHLFTLDVPAGVINERKSYFLEYDPTGKYVISDNIMRCGKWKWHEVYEQICPHGCAIPGEITDRILHDPENMGINGALLVMAPSYDEYKRLIGDISRPEVRQMIGNQFKWPEMQYITMAWSGRWTNIDLRFCGLNGYPDVSALCGIHFAGAKPWNIKDRRTIERFKRLPDHIFWFDTYKRMIEEGFPKLQRIPKLARLLHLIREHDLYTNTPPHNPSPRLRFVHTK